ncbi:MAG TPA: SDR family NAD(P)-dependent oxidoreductase [Casimicrobiaceae bacterium]|nr:SDR family NAD(P)-dependent oxidoreductase [Casimicrobiaceae bacterium]
MPSPPQTLPAAVDLTLLPQDERVVLVTGATGGLGREIALACARAGATVILHGRVVRKLEDLYDEIMAAKLPEPVILPLDFARAEASDFANAASALTAQLGRLDAIVHTAAILGSLGPIEHQSFDNWLALLRVNVAAPMGLTRIMMPLLAKAPDASIAFTLDSRGQEPRAYWGGYAVTKAGVAALARELADEWENRPNLRVNAIVPGPIRSPLRRQSHPGEDSSALPAPEALVPLYLHLIAGQTKADSDALIDAQAWLAGSPCATSLRP